MHKGTYSPRRCSWRLMTVIAAACLAANACSGASSGGAPPSPGARFPESLFLVATGFGETIAAARDDCRLEIAKQVLSETAGACQHHTRLSNDELWRDYRCESAVKAQLPQSNLITFPASLRVESAGQDCRVSCVLNKAKYVSAVLEELELVIGRFDKEATVATSLLEGADAYPRSRRAFDELQSLFDEASVLGMILLGLGRDAVLFREIEEQYRELSQAQAEAEARWLSRAPSPEERTAGFEWVLVEGGAFQMGSAAGHSDEQPVHEVRLKSFEMLRTEVTVGMYRRLTGQETFGRTGLDESGQERGLDTMPVGNVTWREATAFCRSIGGDLPTEAQWEYAARGTDAMRYPWGNSLPTCELVVARGCLKSGVGAVGSLPNGATQHRPTGLVDLIGNVSEWVRDDWALYRSEVQYEPCQGAGRGDKITRGGSASRALDDGYLSTTSRNRVEPGTRSPFIGFRCIR